MLLFNGLKRYLCPAEADAVRKARWSGVSLQVEPLEKREMPAAAVILYAVGTDAGPPAEVKVYAAATNAFQLDFFPYGGFTGGVRIALGDVSGDGVADVVTGPGPGGGPNIEVFDGATGNLLRSFIAYDADFTGGVFVAAGDFNADGFADVVVGPDSGGGPNVIVFDGKSITGGQPIATLYNAFAFNPGFTGGVRVAAGDVNGGGHADLIVGAGPGGGPNVAIIDLNLVSPGGAPVGLGSFFPYATGFTGGVYVAAGDTTGAGMAAMIITGAGAGGGPNVSSFSLSNGAASPVLNYFAFAPDFTGGVRVAVVAQNGSLNINAAAGPGGGPHVQIANGATGQVVNQFFAFDPSVNAGLFVAGSPGSAFATPPEPLGHAGRWIADATGRVIITRGVNMVNKLAPYTPAFAGFSDDDAALIAHEGFNVVRVGVIYSAVEPAPGLYDSAYLDSIHSTVAMLHRHGVLSLIDFHQDLWGPSFSAEGFPEWATLTDGHPIRPIYGLPDTYAKSPALQHAFDNFFANTPGPGGVGIQDRFAAAWAYTANRLKDTPGILGWELLNEPFDGTHGAKPRDPVLNAFSERVLQAIRAVDTDHFVWYEPWINFDEGLPFRGTLAGPRVGFAFHNYVPAGAKQTPYENAEAQSARTGNALLATEFGAVEDPTVIQAEVDNADSFMMSAIYWAYWNRTPFEITAGGLGGGNGATQGLVYDITLPLTAGNVSEPKLDALVRPYPRAVSGTPSQWHYDSASRIFEFVYSTTPAGGAALPAQAETEVFVPDRQYPEGYQVTVTGAQVVSGEGNQLLHLVNQSGAAQVIVRITPK